LIIFDKIIVKKSYDSIRVVFKRSANCQQKLSHSRENLFSREQHFLPKNEISRNLISNSLPVLPERHFAAFLKSASNGLFLEKAKF
jgi:hypothetical protein